MKNIIGAELDEALQQIYNICEVNGIKIDGLTIDEQRYFFLLDYWGWAECEGACNLNFKGIPINKKYIR